MPILLFFLQVVTVTNRKWAKPDWNAHFRSPDRAIGLTD